MSITIYLYLYLSIYLSTYLSIYLCIYLSIYLSICLSTSTNLPVNAIVRVLYPWSGESQRQDYIYMYRICSSERPERSFNLGFSKGGAHSGEALFRGTCSLNIYIYIYIYIYINLNKKNNNSNKTTYLNKLYMYKFVLSIFFGR